MKIFLCIAILCSVLLGYSQNTQQPNDLDKIYTPPTGSIFDNNTSKNTNSPNRNSNVTQSKNIILFNLASVARSNVYLTYERALNQYFSVQAGLGRYFGRDAIGFFGSEILEDLSSNNEKLSQYQTIWNAMNTDFVSGGIQFGVNGRYYFDEDFDSRSYIELGSRFYQWHFKAKSSSYSTMVFYGSPEFTISNQQYFFNYGKQWSNGDKVKFTHEFYYGIGIRFYSCDDLKEVTITDSYNTYTVYQLTNNRNKFKTVSFLLGYKLGIGW